MCARLGAQHMYLQQCLMAVVNCEIQIQTSRIICVSQETRRL